MTSNRKRWLIAVLVVVLAAGGYMDVGTCDETVCYGFIALPAIAIAE